MARGISEQDVFSAADTLLMRGERPTIERVRQTLGRGSPNTVNRLLDQWWQQLAGRVAGKDPDGLPASVIQLCHSLYAELRDQARAAADTGLRVAEEALEAERAELERTSQSLSAERMAMRSMVENLRQELSLLNESHRQVIQRNGEVEATLQAELRRSAAEKQEAETKLAERDSRILELQREITYVREQWQGNEAHWLRSIDQLREELKRRQSEHEKQLRAYERRLAEALRKADEGELQLRAHQTQIAGLERDLALETAARRSAESAAAEAQQRPKTRRLVALRGPVRR